jgi:dolichol-phosphate mannosyltransferase
VTPSAPIFNPRINLWQDWLDTYELEPYLLYRAVTTRGLRVTEAPMKVICHAKGTTKMKPVRIGGASCARCCIWLGVRK